MPSALCSSTTTFAVLRSPWTTIGRRECRYLSAWHTSINDWQRSPVAGRHSMKSDIVFPTMSSRTSTRSLRVALKQAPCRRTMLGWCSFLSTRSSLPMSASDLLPTAPLWNFRATGDPWYSPAVTTPKPPLPRQICGWTTSSSSWMSHCSILPISRTCPTKESSPAKASPVAVVGAFEAASFAAAALAVESWPPPPSAAAAPIPAGGIARDRRNSACTRMTFSFR
mmetsp:Transcript_49179/g.138836  ORF Transcript_49179/g.138836 Transcript_49179/m.138836 type:complete len:225 (+) Transcript_49179:3-677(+)